MKRTRTFLLVSLLMLSSQSWAQKVGFLMDNYFIDRWYTDERLFSEKVKELGGEYITADARGDADEQVRQGKKMIADGVDVLVIVPTDARKAVDLVEAAHAANIPVLAYDRLILDKNLSFYISYDNAKVGTLQAQYALSKMPKGNYLLINGPTSDNNAIFYRNGHLEVLKSSIESKKVKLIGDYVLDAWSELESMMKTQDHFTNHPDKPDVIIAANDALATGAIQSLPADMVGKVIVVGQDAELTAIRNIIAGSQTMTIYKPIRPLAYQAAEIAVKLGKKQPVVNASKLKAGEIEFNALLLEPVVVDINNYKETVIKDGHIKLDASTNK
jgi:D-xylose transport system substrate-binding protein